MFGLNGVSLYLFFALALALVGAGGGVWYLWDERDALLKDKGALEQSLEVQRATADAAKANAKVWAKSATAYREAVEDLSKVKSEATVALARLNEGFNAHDLAVLAAKKPKLVQDRVNAGSAAARGMLERASRTGDGAGRPGETRQPPAGAAAGAPQPPAGAVDGQSRNVLP
jgi:hypothetical protein